MVGRSTCSPALDDEFGPIVSLACRDGFDFTLLFEQTILALPPTILFSTAGFALAYSRYRGGPRESLQSTQSAGRLWRFSRSWILIAPTLVHVGLQALLLGLWAMQTAQRTRASIPSAACSLLASMFLCVVIYSEHAHSPRPSSPALLYLLVSAISDAVQVRTLWTMNEAPQPIAIIQAICVGLKLLMFLIELHAPKFLPPDERRACPEALSSVFSRASFWWLNPLMWKGARQTLRLDHLWPIDPALASSYSNGTSQAQWQLHSSLVGRRGISSKLFREHRLLPAFLVAQKWNLLAPVPAKVIALGFIWVQPFLIARTTAYIQRSESERNQNAAYGLIGATFLTFVGSALATGYHNHKLARSLAGARGALTSLLYDKTLRLPSRMAKDSGVVTLMSTDIDRIIATLDVVHETWAGIITTGVGIYVLNLYVRTACLAPALLAIGCTAANSFISKYLPERRKAWIQAIQDRIAYTQAVIGNIRSVRLMGLSDRMMRNIQRARTDELEISKSFRRLVTWTNAFANTPSKLSVAFCFSIYTAIGGEMSAYNVFAALAIIELLTSGLLTVLAALPSLVACLGNFDRLQVFLEAAELPGAAPPTVATSRLTKKGCDAMLGLGVLVATTPVSGNECNHGDSRQTVAVSRRLCSLKEAAQSAHRPSETTLVLGPGGCGKSTLLRILLGEVESVRMTSAAMLVGHAVAFCGQQPWLYQGSVMSTVTMNLPLDYDWYQHVLWICALDSEFMDRGESFDIGDNGSALSGGQKHRVALARALYSRNAVLLLDDVFSALDSDTQMIIAERLLGSSGLAKAHGMTVVLTSPTASLERYADNVLTLSSNGVVENCRKGQLQHSKSNTIRSAVKPPEQCERIGADPLQDRTEKSPASGVEVTSKPANPGYTGDASVWRYYFLSVGIALTIPMILLAVSGVILTRMQQIWLLLWVTSGSETNDKYLAILWGFAVAGLAATTLTIWFMGLLAIPVSANRLHQTLLTSVLGSPLSHVTTSSVGSLINRFGTFSQDMTTIDNDLPAALLATMMILAGCLAQLVVFAIGSRYVGIAIPFILAAVYLLQNFYLRTSRQMRLLDLEAKSPLYTIFSQTSEGLTTIRAFQWNDMFARQLAEVLEQSQRPFYTMHCIQGWLTLSLSLLVAGLAIVLVTCATLLTNSSSGASFGVSMVSLIGLGDGIMALIRSWTALETSLGSVYRIKTYVQDAPQERSTSINDSTTPSDWPSTGALSIRNVTAAHVVRSPDSIMETIRCTAGDDMKSLRCLDDISLEIAAGTKVGICGRTGSGKSSLLATVCRMLELEAGNILIDGIDISTVAPETVRNRLNTLPQDALFVPGTVRSNMFVPFECADSAMVDVLHKVGLWDMIREKGGLDEAFATLSLSQGQRQVFRIASAMLRFSNLLILDEATSNMDDETEAHIWATIQSAFPKSTILVVAHRLRALVQCDLVVVLDSAAVVEVGRPDDLLQSHSRFRRLWEAQNHSQPHS